MYANLKVTIDGVDYYAWAVVIAGGETTVHLDDPNDESDDAVPVGTLSASGAKYVNVSASF